MGSSASAHNIALARSVRVTESNLEIDLSDGRTITVPVSRFPRLLHASGVERENWRLIANGEGIRWPDLDEDIRVQSVLAGRRSDESEASFARWVEKHRLPA
jgi:hypothetical protein